MPLHCECNARMLLDVCTWHSQHLFLETLLTKMLALGFYKFSCGKLIPLLIDNSLLESGNDLFANMLIQH